MLDGCMRSNMFVMRSFLLSRECVVQFISGYDRRVEFLLHG